MPDTTSGRLLEPSDAPPRGERVEKIARIGNLRIEQILSGHVEPAEYLQGHDEWVVVLAGSATLDVDGVIRESDPATGCCCRPTRRIVCCARNRAPAGWPCTCTKTTPVTSNGYEMRLENARAGRQGQTVRPSAPSRARKVTSAIGFPSAWDMWTEVT